MKLKVALVLMLHDSLASPTKVLRDLGLLRVSHLLHMVLD